MTASQCAFTGRDDVTKADSAIASIALSNVIFVESVHPCVTRGSPSSPSQQSSSTERQPCSSSRPYISAELMPAI